MSVCPRRISRLRFFRPFVSWARRCYERLCCLDAAEDDLEELKLEVKSLKDQVNTQEETLREVRGGLSPARATVTVASSFLF
jgi:hypothetical protein